MSVPRKNNGALRVSIRLQLLLLAQQLRLLSMFSCLATNFLFPFVGGWPLIFNCFWFFSVVPLWRCYRGCLPCCYATPRGYSHFSFWPNKRTFHIKSLDKYIFSHCLLDTRVFLLKPNSITTRYDRESIYLLRKETSVDSLLVQAQYFYR